MMDNSPQIQPDFGPLQALIDDSEVDEIMVNGPDQVYVEQHGKLQKVDVTFRDSEHIIEVINHLLAVIVPNLQVSRDHPYTEARFPDGTRLIAFIPPIAISGPSLTILKAARGVLTLKDLLTWGTFNEDMGSFLEACVRARLNILIAGGVGSGKTTLLNALAATIPPDERIVTVEEQAELRLAHEHVVILERRPPNWEGKGEISVKDLLPMAARARPDRLLLGELNGAEVLEALRLMDRGYDGTMTTIFANSPQEALERLEMMVKMYNPNLPASYLRSLISSAINIVVQQMRLEDGTRKVVRITELSPTWGGGDYELNDVFVFQWEGIEGGKVIGHFESHPVSLNLRRRMEARQITLPPSLVAEADTAEEA